MYINKDIEIGPGLTRVNSSLLNEPTKLLAIITELGGMIAQIPIDWDPRQKLEYVKMSISCMVGRDRSELRRCVNEIEESLLEIHETKVYACALADGYEKSIGKKGGRA